MSDIETEMALRDALGRHSAARPFNHTCWTDCPPDIYARLTPGSVGSFESFGQAFQTHVEVVPVVSWDTYGLPSTDHGCGEACSTDVAARLLIVEAAIGR